MQQSTSTPVTRTIRLASGDHLHVTIMFLNFTTRQTCTSRPIQPAPAASPQAA
jgi:hypothetical protein